MASLGNLLISVGADLTAFNAAMGDLDGKLADAEKSASNSWSGFEALAGRMKDVGATLTAAITVPLVGIGAASTMAFAGFEASLNKVAALSEGITKDQLAKLHDQAIKLGADTQFSAKQAADGMAELAAAGYTATQTMAAMPGVLDLAAAGQLSIAEASTVATDAIAQFALTANDTGRVANVLALAAAKGKDSVQGIGTAMSYVGGVAHSAGLTLEQTAAALTELANAGDRGEKAGTRLREILIRLAAPPAAARKELENLGVSVTDTSGKMLPFADIIQQLADKHLTLKEAAKIAGQEGASGLLNLVTAGAPALRDLTNDLEKTKTAAHDMAGTLNSGLNGAMERMKGSIETAGIALGEALAPTLIKVAGVIEEAGNKAAEFAGWFGKLPEPVKETAIVLAALAAAIGPVLFVAGQLGTAIIGIQGASKLLIPYIADMGSAIAGLAFNPWILGITAVTVALTALGVWVYQNWDPIKATVLQAWDGLSEMWSAAWAPIEKTLTGAWGAIAGAAKSVWAPIQAFFNSIWDGTAGYMSSAWNAISGSLTGVWNSIKSAASTVWGGIVSVFQEFLSWAAKIPGANKLMNLDEAWASAKKAADALKQTTDQTKAATTAATAHGKAQSDGAKATGAATDAVGKLGRGHKETSTFVKDHTDKTSLLYATEKILRDEHQKHITALAELKIKYADLSKVVPELIQPSEELNKLIDEQATKTSTAKDAIKIWGDELKRQMNDAEAPIKAVDQAFKDLGITSSTSLQEQANKAQAAYNTIRDSGTASANDVNAAFAKMEEARLKAAVAAGTVTQEEAKKALDGIRGDLDSSVSLQTKTWTKFGTDVSSTWQNVTKDITREFDGLVSGSLSDLIGGKGFGAIADKAKQVGESILKDLMKPVEDSLSSLMSGVIKDFIGGKGLGGIVDAAKTAGSAIAGVFGGGASAAGEAAGTAASTAGQAAGGAASAGGSAASTAGAVAGSSLTGIVGAAGAIASAISGIIGNFQNARQETTLNAIEESTRYTMIYIGKQDQSVLWSTQTTAERLNYVNASLDTLKNNMLDWLQPVPTFLADVAQQLHYAVPRLDQIGDSVTWGSASDKAAESILSDIRDAARNDSVAREQLNLLAQIRDAVRNSGAAPAAKSLGASAATQGFVFA
jgi:TP901 family phage tail tape measure protein